MEEGFFYTGSRFRRAGRRYLLFTRTFEGRYMVVIYEILAGVATIVSARQMTAAERRFLRRK